MNFIAHRGVVKEGVKENSIEAFKLAIKDDSFIGFELDIRVSKDSIFVVNHDFIINNKLVKNMYYKELEKLGLCTLKDVLKLYTDKIIMVEIKDFDIDLDKLHRMINKYSNIYVMSFNNKVIHKLSKYKRKYKVGVLNYLLNSEDNYDYLDFICLLNNSITNNIVRYFTDNNIELFSYGMAKNASYLYDSVKYIVDYKF